VQLIYKENYRILKAKHGRVITVLNHHAMMAYRGREIKLHAFLASALDSDGRSVSRSNRFSLGKATQLPNGEGLNGPVIW